MTKTWGFSNPAAPLQFSRRGWFHRARAMLKPDDLVVIVGTVGEETAPEEQGRILGLVEPTNILVHSLDYVSARGPRDYGAVGYRWPYGLELRQAWRFSEPRRLFADLCPRNFGWEATLGIVRLLPSEAERIMELPRSAIDLLRPFHADARVHGIETARIHAAPPPTTTRQGVMHLRRAPAYTYAMRLEGADASAFKIGWAFDWKVRARQFNQTAMPKLGGLHYKPFLYQRWKTAFEAFEMEQSILRRFRELRHSDNHEVISPLESEILATAWGEYVGRWKTA